MADTDASTGHNCGKNHLRDTVMHGDLAVTRRYARSRFALTSETTTELIMYSTTWCGYCRQLKRQLTGQGVGFTEINIEETPGAAEFVMSVNGGNQTVPTVLFPDGSTLTNPSMSQVRAQLDGIAS
jgi:mycoredoxin